MDVKVSILSCITEITRITAPDAPYDDEKMKEIFQLIVAVFENLSHVSSHNYMKAVSILDIVAKVKSCLVMLDLEYDALVVEMFQTFFKIISSNHPHEVFSAMETIMTMVIDESDDISLDLLRLLASDAFCPTKVGQAVDDTFKLLVGDSTILDEDVVSFSSPIPHIEFIIPDKFNDVMESKAHLFSVLPTVVPDWKQVLHVRIFLLQHYKTRNSRSSFFQPGEYDAGAEYLFYFYLI
jgi:hypothetical protein